MVPKEFGFNQSQSDFGLCARLAWRFADSPATARDGKLWQMPFSCHHVETIRHPNSSYVTTKMHGTSTCGCNYNRIFFFKNSHFNVSYRRCMLRTLAWRRAGLGHACQSGNMAILLTSLFFVFTISFQPKSTESTIMIILKSGALGYNVVGVYSRIFPTF